MKPALKIVALFIIGMGGGIFANQIFWSYFYEYQLEKAPVYLTETKEIYIQENVALRDHFERVKNSVIAIRSISSAGHVIEGSGLVVTNDGLIVTLAEVVPRNYEFSFFVNGEKRPYQVLKRDLNLNLALVKLEGNNFSTVGFRDSRRLRAGERIFLVGNFPSGESFFKIINEGIIRYFDSDHIYTTIREDSKLKGSILFNMEREAVGISVINKSGEVSAIPAEKIKEFAGF